MDPGSISVERVSLESGIYVYNAGSTIWDLKSEGHLDAFSLHTVILTQLFVSDVHSLCLWQITVKYN